MKKNKISLIFLIAIGYLLPSLSFAINANAAETDKSIHATIQKKGEHYEIAKLNIAIEKGIYVSDYKSYEGKISNGTIVSFKGEQLAYFSVPNGLEASLCEDSTNISTGKMSGSCSDLSEGEITIDIPCFPNGKYADIYDYFGKKVLTIDLSSKATCNENDKCDRPIEDGENCPQDCKKNEPKIDPVVVQLAANNQTVAQEAEKKISLADLGWWGIAILIILLAGGGIGYYVYRKNRDPV